MKRIITSLRPHFWVLSIIPALTGACLASHLIDWKQFLLIAILIGPCLSGIAEIVNDYSDRELDKLQKVKRIFGLPLAGGSGVLGLGGITLEETLAASIILVIVSLAIALSINQSVVILWFIGLAIALGYSLEPIRLKTKGFWGVIAVAGFRGLLSFHIGWLAFASINPASLIIGTFLTFLYFTGFTTSHISDYHEDKKLGINTFPVQAGFRNACLASAGSIVGAFILLSAANRANLVQVNAISVLVLILSGLLFAKLLTLDENGSNLPRLEIQAIILLCVAPLIFL